MRLVCYHCNTPRYGMKVFPRKEDNLQPLAQVGSLLPFSLMEPKPLSLRPMRHLFCDLVRYGEDHRRSNLHTRLIPFISCGIRSQSCNRRLFWINSAHKYTTNQKLVAQRGFEPTICSLRGSRPHL